MKNKLKSFIRWFYEGDHIGFVIYSAFVIALSLAVGLACYQSGYGVALSTVIGVFAFPLIIVAITVFSIVIGLPFGCVIYSLVWVKEEAMPRLRRWAYSKNYDE